MRINTSDLGFKHQIPIYVNEHLCPKLKRIMGLVPAQKRGNGWKFFWVRNGNIFPQKSEDASIPNISSWNEAKT